MSSLALFEPMVQETTFRIPRCDRAGPTLLGLLLGLSLALLLSRRDGHRLVIPDSEISLAGALQYKTPGVQPLRQTTSRAWEYASTIRAISKASVFATSEGAVPYLKLGDIVSHKKRGQGTVVSVDPAVEVKYDTDEDPAPISYTSQDGAPLPESKVREKLTLVSPAKIPAKEWIAAWEKRQKAGESSGAKKWLREQVTGDPQKRIRDKFFR